MSSFAIGSLVIAFIVFFPVIIPVTIFLSHRYRRKLRKLVKATPCQKCSKFLGLEALCLADAEWSAHVAELRNQNPGVRMRLIRTLHAIFPHCGARYTFYEKENELRI